MLTDSEPSISDLIELDLPTAPRAVTPAPDPLPAPTPPPPVARAITPPSANPWAEPARIDAAGAARATADEKAARSLGFSPAPPVYEIGTTVNSLGVANFQRSRLDWEALPSIPELAATFADRVKAEQRADQVIAAPDLVLLPDGRLGLKAGGNLSLHVSERALEGLASHVTPGGAGYLRQCPPELRAANLNHWLGTANVLDARASAKAKQPVYRPKEVTLRTRARRGGFREAYAVTGPKYAPFNVDRVATEAARGIGGDARGTITYDGYKMTLDAMFHSNVRAENAVAGEFFKGTIRVKAADDGTGSVNVKLGLWRNLCRNLLIVDFDTVLVGRRRHVGAATIEADIRDLMVEASNRIGLIVDKWSEASVENVLARYDLQDVDQVFAGLVLNKAVHVPGIKPDDMIKKLHTAWEREPGYSKTAILNAITRAAHEDTWSSWSDAEDLESTAGALLYQKVWNLDTSSRTAEEVLA